MNGNGLTAYTSVLLENMKNTYCAEHNALLLPVVPEVARGCLNFLVRPWSVPGKTWDQKVWRREYSPNSTITEERHLDVDVCLLVRKLGGNQEVHLPVTGILTNGLTGYWSTILPCYLLTFWTRELIYLDQSIFFFNLCELDLSSHISVVAAEQDTRVCAQISHYHRYVVLCSRAYATLKIHQSKFKQTCGLTAISEKLISDCHILGTLQCITSSYV